MNEILEILSDKDVETLLSDFLKHHGKRGLIRALQSYSNLQQEYICKTKTSISKIKMDDILYIKIQGHTITIHTAASTYQKYGSLNGELNALPRNEFIRCSKNCIVSLHKIRDICSNDITLFNNTKIHMSRNYAQKVIIAFLALSV